MNDCINCVNCENIDKEEHEGFCRLKNIKVFVQIDGCDDFVWKEVNYPPPP